jgi:hypothetical protein
MVEDSSRSLNASAGDFWILTCSIILLFLPLALTADELPAGTTLEVRLSNVTGSRSSHRGDSVEASVSAPISIQGRILVPQGSTLLGTVAKADAIGLGLKHVTAMLSSTQSIYRTARRFPSKLNWWK